MLSSFTNPQKKIREKVSPALSYRATIIASGILCLILGGILSGIIASDKSLGFNSDAMKKIFTNPGQYPCQFALFCMLSASVIIFAVSMTGCFYNKMRVQRNIHQAKKDIIEEGGQVESVETTQVEAYRGAIVAARAIPEKCNIKAKEFQSPSTVNFVNALSDFSTCYASVLESLRETPEVHSVNFNWSTRCSEIQWMGTILTALDPTDTAESTNTLLYIRDLAANLAAKLRPPETNPNLEKVFASNKETILKINSSISSMRKAGNEIGYQTIVTITHAIPEKCSAIQAKLDPSQDFVPVGFVNALSDFSTSYASVLESLLGTPEVRSVNFNWDAQYDHIHTVDSWLTKLLEEAPNITTTHLQLIQTAVGLLQVDLSQQFKKNENAPEFLTLGQENITTIERNIESMQTIYDEIIKKETYNKIKQKEETSKPDNAVASPSLSQPSSTPLSEPHTSLGLSL